MSTARRNTYVKTPSTSTLLSLDTARKACRQDFTNDDDLILACARCAEYQAEIFMRRTIMPKTLVLQLDSFPSYPYRGEIIIDQGRVSRLVEFRYRDENDELQILDPELYSLDNNDVPDVIALEPEQCWPSVKYGRRNAVEIEFVAGYDAPEQVPEPIVQGVKYLTKHFYDNPDMVVVGTSQAVQVPQTVDLVLWPFRDYRWGNG